VEQDSVTEPRVVFSAARQPVEGRRGEGEVRKPRTQTELVGHTQSERVLTFPCASDMRVESVLPVCVCVCVCSGRTDIYIYVYERIYVCVHIYIYPFSLCIYKYIYSGHTISERAPTCPCAFLGHACGIRSPCGKLV